jgi:hypothetical protein
LFLLTLVWGREREIKVYIRSASNPRMAVFRRLGVYRGAIPLFVKLISFGRPLRFGYFRLKMANISFKTGHSVSKAGFSFVILVLKAWMHMRDILCHLLSCLS